MCILMLGKPVKGPGIRENEVNESSKGNMFGEIYRLDFRAGKGSLLIGTIKLLDPVNKNFTTRECTWRVNSIFNLKKRTF